MSAVLSPRPSYLLRTIGTNRTARLRSRRAALWLRVVLPGTIIALFVVVAIFAPLISPYNPDVENSVHILTAPSVHHWLGTDELGRDLLSRLMFGARLSLAICAVAVIVSTVVGFSLGVIAGYFGGFFDSAIGRFADAIFAFPLVLLAVALAAVLGPSVRSATIAIAIVPITEFIRVTRSLVIAERERAYVEASRALNSSKPYIIFRVIVPNIRGSLVTMVSLGLAYAILNEAALGFLGLGAQPPAASWGSMINDGINYTWNAPWLVIFPGVAIFVIVASLNLFGDGFRSLGSQGV